MMRKSRSLSGPDSPGGAPEKDDFFGFVFCDDLGTDVLDFLLNIHGVLDFGAAFYASK